jgi:sialic acid synthase SpsE/sugar phosphate isomerase/epimerase
MLLIKKISAYMVFESETILKALEKISANKKRIVFVVSEYGKLLGSITDGDFRRWITTASEFDLQQDVSNVMNTQVQSASIDADQSKVEALFSNAIDLIPLVDPSERLVAIAIKNEKGLLIGSHIISESSPAFIIAEIGNNHNGDINLAKELVDLACEAGADCVKFQMRDVNSLYKNGNLSDSTADLGVQYTMDLLRKYQLKNEELIDVFDYCKQKGLTPLCTPWDLISLGVLEAYGMEAYKVASADFTNHELLEALSATGKPLICSTGMSTEFEIKRSIELLRKNAVNFALLHCNSTYPTPYKDVNLAYMPRLKELSGTIIGYSGHERGISVPIAAVTLGAKIIEKHFTIDKSMDGNDHKVSLLPDEFRQMVSEIRAVEESIGSKGERSITQGEMLNRETLAKSIVINRSLEKGGVITRGMLEIKSPGQGLQPLYLEQLIGRHSKRDLVSGDYFYESDLAVEEVIPRNYKFKRPFGIPVRYHDYEVLSKKSNFDFVEFHLSYQDMDIDPNKHFSSIQGIRFAVHSPELFEGDHIMDLASEDEAYRLRSIEELQRVCDITRKLKRFFFGNEKPVIVINAGGFSAHGFLAKASVMKMYETVADSLSYVNQEGVEILIQTMPPFPWHFGGQSHHNLFVDPTEIKSFCEHHDYRICYDVSHSMMACNYYNWELTDFTKAVGPYTAHIHIVDALGVDGEGVQIGAGDVDFEEFSQDIDAFAPNIMFLPEVWQGHKNQGEGFWHAFEFLESVL